MTIGSEREKEGEGERRKRTNLPTRHFTRRRVESSQEWKTFGIGDWLQKGEGLLQSRGRGAPRESVDQVSWTGGKRGEEGAQESTIEEEGGKEEEQLRKG